MFVLLMVLHYKLTTYYDVRVRFYEVAVVRIPNQRSWPTTRQSMSVDVKKVLSGNKAKTLCSHATSVRRNRHRIPWCYILEGDASGGRYVVVGSNARCRASQLVYHSTDCMIQRSWVRVTFHVFDPPEPRFARCCDWVENSGWVVVRNHGSKYTPLLHKKRMTYSCRTNCDDVALE
jgi:hypothetical protein